MTDSMPATSTCPWCSAEVPAGRTTCPACGANLVETADPAVPGLTAIDPEAVLRNVRASSGPARRSRILSLITGEEPDAEAAVGSSPTALAPPPLEVRREMLRMEIAAELTNATAEAEALAADEALDAADAGAPAQLPPADPDVAAVSDGTAGDGDGVPGSPPA